MGKHFPPIRLPLGGLQQFGVLDQMIQKVLVPSTKKGNQQPITLQRFLSEVGNDKGKVSLSVTDVEEQLEDLIVRSMGTHLAWLSERRPMQIAIGI